MTEVRKVYEPSQTTHWKNLFPHKTQILGSHNLNPGEELIATIESVAIEPMMNKNGKEENLPVAHFTNTPPMILNVTNSRTIASLYGPWQDNWIGKKVQIFATNVKSFGGGEELGLRIRTLIPADADEVKSYRDRLSSCRDMNELQSAFLKVPTHLRRQLISLKDQCKEKLTQSKTKLTQPSSTQETQHA